jgi:hypothetical protein
MNWECQACGQPVARPVLCDGCKALVYCSDAHAREHKHDEQECARMRGNMARSACLAATGLDYSERLAREQEPSHGIACSQLELLGAHEGTFTALCGCGKQAQTSLVAAFVLDPSGVCRIQLTLDRCYCHMVGMVM